jgi:ribosomal-protein-alanine N-acetyltransferase
MTPHDLSQIHAAAFTLSRPWTALEFKTLLGNPHTHLFVRPAGFALLQLIAGEAELLTIAVHPDAQGKGTGQQLMADWMAGVQATEAFLEAAADNTHALQLYTANGFAEVARRKSYYARKSGDSVDAIVMRAALT